MNKETNTFHPAHIRITIQSDYARDTDGSTYYNNADTLVFTTINPKQVRSIVLEDNDYYKLVVDGLEMFIEEYKAKYLKEGENNGK